MSGQKVIKNAKNCQFGEFLKNVKFRSNSVTRHVNLNEQKLMERAKCCYQKVILIEQKLLKNAKLR